MLALFAEDGAAADGVRSPDAGELAVLEGVDALFVGHCPVGVAPDELKYVVDGTP